MVCLGYGHRALEECGVKLGFNGFYFGVEIVYVGVMCVPDLFLVLGGNGGGNEQD